MFGFGIKLGISREMLSFLAMVSGLTPGEVERLLSPHHAYLTALLRFKCRDVNLAGDLLQETYLAFLTSGKGMENFPTPEKVRNFLITIAINKLRDHSRRIRTKNKYVYSFSSSEALDGVLENITDQNPNPENLWVEEAERKTLSLLVNLTLEALPDNYRRLLLLKYRDFRDNQSLALEMDLGLKAMESLLIRAKSRFKKDFETFALKAKVFESTGVN